MDDPSSLLARLTRVVAGTTTGVPLALRLCLALNDILDVDGSTLSIGYSPTRTTLCATDDRAQRVEDLQEVLRQGPGLDAHRLAEPVSAAAGDVTDRWPMLGQALGQESRPALLLAVPMRPGHEVLGVITMYRSVARAPEVDADQAQFLANAIGVAVVGGFEREEYAGTLWFTRDQVNQATGMVVAQLHVPPTDALAVLRAHAFAHNTSLEAIAAAVVTRDLDFRSTDNPRKPREGDGTR
jgi:hypothetical protein